MKKEKILILVPSPKSPGGVGHYYQKIQPYFTFQVSYFIRGVRNQQSFSSRAVYPLIQLCDYVRFIFLLAFKRFEIVQFNTSFGITGIIRDSIFIAITRLFRKKYIVFFRGIEEKVINKVEQNYFALLSKTFLKADSIWVLSEKLKRKIIEWGYSGTLELETTLVDPALLGNFDFDHNLGKYNQAQAFELLFLSRVEKNKGIYEAIEAFRIARKDIPQLRLIICGSGSKTDEVLAFIGTDLNKDIFFKGFVGGKEKVQVLSNAHLFLFPSYYEGMPNALLEALAFGLPVITSAVGGIPDIFIDQKMGFITNDISPLNLSVLIKRLAGNIPVCREIAKFNYSYAREHFYADMVARRLEKYYLTLING